jgi:hypothetical protein
LHDYEQVEPNVEPTEERLAIEEAAEAKNLVIWDQDDNAVLTAMVEALVDASHDEKCYSIEAFSKSHTILKNLPCGP